MAAQHPIRNLSRIASLTILIASVVCPSLKAQEASSASSREASSAHIILVLPFDGEVSPATTPAAASPATPSPATPSAGNTASSLDWFREAAPEILNSRFTSAGFAPITREDRLYALDHLGLPENFQPSRATAVRLAQTLDADSILIGTYTTSGTKLTLKAHFIDVAKLHNGPEVTQSGEISQLIPLLNSLAWQLTRQLDPGFSVGEETFRAAGSKIRLDAFEQYVRGLTEHDPQERLRHLKKATDLSPDFSAAWLATAKIQFASQQYEDAAVSFAKVTSAGQSSGASTPTDLEASFYRGLSLMFSGGYPRAEEAFAAIARVLPLPEVVNDQAVAMSRRSHDATALFRQAVAADPTDPDYHFNLAVSLHRQGNKAEAQTELAQTLRLRPNDSEAKALDANWKATPESPGTEPLERIKRSFNGAAFRQAAQMLDQVESTRLAALPAAERAAKLAASAHEKLDRGLLLEAERGYQAAIAADDHSAAAHAGLAQVRERAGDSSTARKEAQAALDRNPNLEAYLVLARLDLSANQLDAARNETTEALKLDPNNRPAKDLRKAIDTRATAAAPPKP